MDRESIHSVAAIKAENRFVIARREASKIVGLPRLAQGGGSTCIIAHIDTMITVNETANAIHRTRSLAANVRSIGRNDRRHLSRIFRASLSCGQCQ